MSAPITEAHIELLVSAKRSLNYEEGAQLIADSEARAVTTALRELNEARNAERLARVQLDAARAQRDALLEITWLDTPGTPHETAAQWRAEFDKNWERKVVCDRLRAEVERLRDIGFVETLIRAERAEAALAAERARLDWLSARGFEHRHHETGDHLGYEWTISSYSEFENVTLRDVIDAAMKEGAK
jgi:hypothetical protein